MDNLDGIIDTMADELRSLLKKKAIENPAMVGIHTGGVWVAERLHRRLKIGQPLSSLDISFYRDDFTRIGMNPQVRPSNILFDVDGQHIILVDDVLYTGRTIRAALNELFDYGRPASVTLAVLIDRGSRDLPLQANVVGINMDLGPDEHVKLTGPEPLTLVQHKSS